MAHSGEIVCADIGKVFDNGKQALSSVNFTIPASGIFALIGRNRAQDDAHPNTVHPAGADDRQGHDRWPRRHGGREEAAGKDGGRPAGGRAVHWMTPFRASPHIFFGGGSAIGFANKGPGGPGPSRTERGGRRLNRRLSGGMKRKVLAAMVIASDAQFIFLDEPSTGLDPISARSCGT